MKCNICKEEGNLFEGVQITNACIDVIPEKIFICKVCAESIAIKILSGNIISVITGLKGLVKK